MLSHWSLIVDPHLDAEGLKVLLVLEVADTSRGSQQRLGGHATTVDTGATNVVTLDNRHLETLLRID